MGGGGYPNNKRAWSQVRVVLNISQKLSAKTSINVTFTELLYSKDMNNEKYMAEELCTWYVSENKFWQFHTCNWVVFFFVVVKLSEEP